MDANPDGYGMWWNPTLAEQRFLAGSIAREPVPFVRREWFLETAFAFAFLATAGGLLLLAEPVGELASASAVASVGVMALATRVHFHIASGFTVPTQLAFVPLLFSVPVTAAPFAVVVAMVLGKLPGVLTGKTSPGRLISSVDNSWFAIGPVAVLVAFQVPPAEAGPAILLLALLAQIGVDFTVSSLRERLETGMPWAAQLREWWVYAVDAALSPVAFAVAINATTEPVLVLGIAPLLGVIAVFARERQARLESIIELKNAYQGTAIVLGNVVEADDGYTGEHCKSVVQLAQAVGEKMELSAERLRNLEFAALLHDVGKIAIPNEIINKPGKLEPDEWKIIQNHTIEGQRMLDQVGGFMREVGLIVRHHHERWDGKGYPDRLAGEAIPFESRIITCCDTWNAMRTDRPYRKALSHVAALEEIEKCAGHQFDPRVAEALTAIVAEPASGPEEGPRDLATLLS